MTYARSDTRCLWQTVLASQHVFIRRYKTVRMSALGRSAVPDAPMALGQDGCARQIGFVLHDHTRILSMLRAGAYRCHIRKPHTRSATPRCLGWRHGPTANQHEQPTRRNPIEHRHSRAATPMCHVAPLPAGTTSSTTKFRPWPTRPPIWLGALRRARNRCRRPTGSSSSSMVAGVPRSTRNNYSARRFRSTARQRKPPDGGHRRDVRSRVGGRGRLGPADATAWAVPARRRVWTLPDLRNEPLALRNCASKPSSTAAAHVRRPTARSEDRGSASTGASRAAKRVPHLAGKNFLGAGVTSVRWAGVYMSKPTNSGGEHGR